MFWVFQGLYKMGTLVRHGLTEKNNIALGGNCFVNLKIILNSYWRWRISKLIQLRQVISDEGLRELDITWRD